MAPSTVENLREKANHEAWYDGKPMHLYLRVIDFDKRSCLYWWRVNTRNGKGTITITREGVTIHSQQVNFDTVPGGTIVFHSVRSID